MTTQSVKYFYIDWENGGSKFLRSSDQITFTAGAQKLIRIHVFHQKSNPESLLLKDWKWISTHASATDSPEASWVAMMSSLLNDRKFLSKPSSFLYLVSSDEHKFAELISLIKPNTLGTIIPINAKITTITDCMEYYCALCSIVFRDNSEKDDHDRLIHLLLCNNASCERSKKGNGFWTESELREHVSKQRRCDICETGLVFCSLSKRDDHMRSVHMKRAGNAARNISSLDHRNDDISVLHFRYSLYPLPCLAEPACVQRFKTTKEQVKHHVTAHECEFPYVCMACVNKYARPVCLRSKAELLEHAKEMGHEDEEFVYT